MGDELGKNTVDMKKYIKNTAILRLFPKSYTQVFFVVVFRRLLVSRVFLLEAVLLNADIRLSG